MQSISEKKTENDALLYLYYKRILDIVFSVFGILMTAIACVIIFIFSLLIEHETNIFYSQKRIGFKGKPFMIYKFRTMCRGAEDEIDKMLLDKGYGFEWRESQKLTDDPRITKLGKLLRRTSIDELPQFLNVLKGEMSIIGPRPLVEGELEVHGGSDSYHNVKPGITGWWACNGRSDTSYEERLRLEYYYIDNISFGLDVKCFFRTLFTLLVKRNGC